MPRCGLSVTCGAVQSHVRSIIRRRMVRDLYIQGYADEGKAEPNPYRASALA